MCSEATLAIEDVAAKALAHGHAQVDVETNAGDAHAGIILVLGQQEGVVVVVMVCVRVAGVASCLRLGCRRHCGRGNMLSAVGKRRPVQRQGECRCVRVLGAF